MRCSGCGKEIPFEGTVCPFCNRDKSNDKKRYELAIVWCIGLGFVGGYLFGGWGLIIGVFVGYGLAVAQSGTGITTPPEVHVTNLTATSTRDSSNEKRLENLIALYSKGLIDEAEYNKKKKEIIDAL